MSKTNHSTTPQKWYSFWEKRDYFKADPHSPKPPFGLLIPPPNVNGELHLGHAMQHCILDAIARFKRMQGFDVLLLPGVDHASIQFEGTFNKKLAKEGVRREDLGREEWIRQAEEFKNQIYKSFHTTWTVMGLSADWPREVYTMDPQVQTAVFEEFKTFWEQDLLYKGAYIVQWCPKCGTAIEDVEMEYVEKQDKLYYLQYGPLVIATTRPETKFADTAVAVHPSDKRYKQYIGKEFEIETLNGKRKIKVIADEAIDPNFGTGAEKVTPGHDFLDYEIGKRHNLPILHVIDKEGKLTDLAGKYAGMKVQEAREAVVSELCKKGLLIKEETFTHSVPVCERCKTVIEPIISEEWFVRMKPLADKALKNISKINFVPHSYLKILSDWIKNIHDWCISRSLWWGIKIPVWYCTKCNSHRVVGKDQDMVISQEKPGKNCQTCGESHWEQDEQIFDTWFSSGLWPMATLGWPSFAKATEGETSENVMLKRYYPWDFEITGAEIKYLWIARMIVLSLWFMDDIPFKNMFFHGTIRDLQGRKMSKSLGNGVDPKELISQWGTDVVRMALYTYTAPGRDGRTSKQVMDERCKAFRNFSTKLRNITKFVVDLKPENSEKLSEPDRSENQGFRDSDSSDALTSRSSEYSEFSEQPHPDDQWILKELDKTITSITKNLEGFKLHLATDVLYEFIWHKFADVYIEKSKARRADAQPILEYVLKTCLELLHPFMPFLTEGLWQKLPHEEDSIMLANWPNKMV